MNTSPLAFDHLVVMMRDELEARAPGFEAAGYTLSAPGVHNLGSANRLIVLDSSYIELLGWQAGEPPRRKEIADQPLGLDALVFRSEDAAQDQQRLLDAGFEANPVSALERPLEFHGKTETASFATVRFAKQPVDGLRIYFCQHLTPQYIWDAELQNHANGARALKRIYIAARDAAQVAQTLATLANASVAASDGQYSIVLPNTELIVKADPDEPAARILSAELLHADGSVQTFDTGLA